MDKMCRGESTGQEAVESVRSPGSAQLCESGSSVRRGIHELPSKSNSLFYSVKDTSEERLGI